MLKSSHDFIGLIFVLFIGIAISTPVAFANGDAKTTHNMAFYVGGTFGYGTTTWKYLIDKTNQDDNTSTPTRVIEGGSVWGLFTGYEFNPSFALEAQYTHFPDADIQFDKGSIYTFMDNVTQMDSKTDAYSLAMKIMTPVFRTRVNVFAEAGAALEHRDDLLAETDTNVGAIFGAGFNANIIPNIMAEVAFQFYTGSGKSEMTPVYDYMPFLYDVTFRLAYRIPI